MEYLSPVVNDVHNKLNTHLTLKINYTRYSIPAKSTTRLDFDIMSKASGSERIDICGAVKEGYIAVDILVLKDNEYVNVGRYNAVKDTPKPVIRPVAKESIKTTETAEKLGITVKDVDPKKESINKVETVEKPALDPIKAMNNTRARKPIAVEAKEPVKAKESVLDAIKDNNEKGE